MTKDRPSFIVVWLTISIAIGVFLWRIDLRAGSDPNNKIILSMISLCGGLFAALLYQVVCGLIDLIKGNGTQAAPESIAEEPPSSLAAASNIQKSPTKNANATSTAKQRATLQQKRHRALKVTALLIVATMLYPPFQLQATGGMIVNYGYGFLFAPPPHGENLYATVNVGMLIAQWIGICLVCGLWWLSCKDAPRSEK